MNASAVVFAKDLEGVATFYDAVTGSEQIDRVEESLYLLGKRKLQLYVVLVPSSIAADLHVADPPRPRQETPIKLVFSVDDLAVARATAPNHGGIVYPPDREWELDSTRRCDGVDPEGNVFQLAEAL